jgi:hypothetical protein
MASTNRSVRVVLPPALGSYVTIFQPRAVNEGDEPKYSISLLWDKGDKAKLVALEKAVEQVAIQKFGPDAPKLLKSGKLRSPLRDGDIDREDDPTYAGKIFLNANSTRQPGVVDAKLNPVFEEQEAYSGCTFRASVAVFPYEAKGNKGVGVGLNNLQVVAKGERIDGRRSAADEFSEFAEEGAGSGGGKPAKGEDLSDIE